MALDLNDHLLQAPDTLFSSLLGYLLSEIILATVSILAGSILRFIGNILGCCIPKVGQALLGSPSSIDTLVLIVALLLSCQTSSIGRVARTGRMSILSCVASSILHVVAREGFLLVELGPSLVSQVITRHIWCVVPCVVVGGLIELTELFFGRTRLVGRFLGGVPCNIAK